MDRLKTTARGAMMGLTALAGVGAGILAATKMITGMSDSMAALRGQIMLVESDQGALNSTFAIAKQISNETGAALGSTINLYGRLARSSEELGYNQSQLWEVTKAINQSFIVSGASMQEAASATLQLSQGIASGTLRGEELNSVMENSPRLAKALAEGMGIARGELRELGSQGKITGKEVVDALLEMSGDIQNDFDKMPMTVSRAMNKVKNELLSVFGAVETDQMIESVEGLADAMKDPEFVQAVRDLSEGLMRFTAVVIENMALLPKWSRALGEAAASLMDSMSLFGSGTSSDYLADMGLDELESELERVNKQIKNLQDADFVLSFRGKEGELERFQTMSKVIGEFIEWRQRMDKQNEISTGITERMTARQEDAAERLKAAWTDDSGMGAAFARIASFQEKAAADQARLTKMWDDANETFDEVFSVEAVKNAKATLAMVKTTGPALVKLNREQAGAAMAAKAHDDAVAGVVQQLDYLGKEIYDAEREAAYADLLRDMGEELAMLKLTKGGREDESDASRELRVAIEKENLARSGLYKEEELTALYQLIDAREVEAQRIDSETAALKAQEKQGDAWADALSDAIARVDEAFVGLWKSAFEGFDNFQAALKDAFLQLLAELAHMAVTRPIVMSFAAGLGVTGSGTAAAAQGGGTFLSSAGTAGGVSSLASSGFGAFTAAGGLYDSVGSGLVSYGMANNSSFAVGAGQSALGQGTTYGAGGWGAAGLAAQSIGGGLVGAYAGREIFGNENSTGVGAAGGAFVGGIIGGMSSYGWGTGVGSAVGAFIGEGLEKMIGDVLGFGGTSNNRVRAKIEDGLVGGPIKDGGGRHKEQEEAIKAVSPAIQAFMSMLGNTDFEGKISASAKHGFEYDGMRTTDTDKFLKTIFTDIIESTEDMSDSMRTFLMSLDGSAQEVLNITTAVVGALGPEGEITGNLKLLVENFDGTAEELFTFTSAIASMSDMLTDNPVTAATEDFETAMEIASEGLMGVYANQEAEVAKLMLAFDGSAESAANLNNALLASRETAYVLTTQLLSLSESIGSVVEATAASYREAAMTQDEIVTARETRLAEIEAEMLTTFDPAKLSELFTEYQSIQSGLFNLLKGDVADEGHGHVL